MIDLILLLSADIDIQSAFARYEDYQAGRGGIFMRQLDAAFTMLRHHPLVGSRYGLHYRRMLIRDFPYGIFYEAQAARIVVAAVVDLRQNPKAIQRRLYGRPEG